MPNPNELKKNILSDMKVELTEMFDRNFETKSFFEKKWPERKNRKGKGSLLHVRGIMRRSIRGSIRSSGVQFSSPLAYVSLHNEGGKFTANIRAHSRRNKKTGNVHNVRAHTRNVNMPQRQFIGDHPQVRQAIGRIISENVKDYFDQLAKELKR